MKKINKLNITSIWLIVCSLILFTICIIYKYNYWKNNNLEYIKKNTLVQIKKFEVESKNISNQKNIIEYSNSNPNIAILSYSGNLIAGDMKYKLGDISNIIENKVSILNITNGIFLVYKISKSDTTIIHYKPLFIKKIINNSFFESEIPFLPIVDNDISLECNSNKKDNLFVTEIDKNILSINKNHNEIFLKKNGIGNTIPLILFYLFIFPTFSFIVLSYLESKNNSFGKNIIIYNISIVLFYLLIYELNSFIAISNSIIFQQEIYFSPLYAENINELFIQTYCLFILIIFNFNYFRKYLKHVIRNKRNYIQLLLSIIAGLLFYLILQFYFDIIYNSSINSDLTQYLPFRIDYFVTFVIFLVFVGIVYTYILITNYIISRNYIIIHVLLSSISFWIISWIYKSINSYLYENIIMYECYFISIILFVYITKKYKNLNEDYFRILFTTVFYLGVFTTIYTQLSNYKFKKSLEYNTLKLSINENPIIDETIKAEFLKLENDSTFISMAKDYKNSKNLKFKNYLIDCFETNNLKELNKLIFIDFNDSQEFEKYNSINVKQDILNSFIELKFTNNTQTILNSENNESKSFRHNIKLDGENTIQIYINTRQNSLIKIKHLPQILFEENELPVQYAIYKNGSIVKTNSIEFSQRDKFANKFKNKKNGSIITKNNYIVYSNENEYRKYFSTKLYSFYDGLVIFSIFYCVVNFLYFLLKFIYFMRRNNYKIGNSFPLKNLNFASRIFILLMIIVLTSTNIVAVLNVNFYLANFKKEYNKTFSKRIEHIDVNSTMHDTLRLNSNYTDEEFEVYNTQGKIIYSTQPIIYSKGIRSDYMPRTLLNKILINNNQEQLVSEKIGNTLFNSGYLVINDIDEKPKYILNLIDINYNSSIETSINNYLNQLFLILFIVIILSSLLASIFSKTITSSLKNLKSQIQLINLNKLDKRISWDSEDEIKELVMEYNLVLDKLEQNFQQLKESERNMAWKNMARQIAHEIKNPLTPMQLNIQHFKRMIAEKPEMALANANSTLDSLLYEINHLNEIASDFSFFSKISTAKKHNINIIPILQQTVNTYKYYPNITINFQYDNDTIYIYANDIQMSKTFGNLIKNSVEAMENKEQGIINISVEINEEKKIIINFRDNGCGIHEDNVSKIFGLNFTTKNSGSGLGLAICKNIVEYHDGKIGFTTDHKNYTTFTIILPFV